MMCILRRMFSYYLFFFFFQAEDGIRGVAVTGVQTCALPIWDANNKKGAVSIDMCQAILDLYNESIEENFINKFKVKKMGYKK